MEVSWIDIGIAIILLISVGVAMFRGFVREAISLASWVAAIWLAITSGNKRMISAIGVLYEPEQNPA